MTSLSVYRQSPLGYQQFTSLSSAITIGTTAPATGATAIPSYAKTMVISVEGAAIRWRDDGTAPTATIGMPVANGASLSYTGTMPTLQIIQQSTGAIVNVMFYG